MVELSALRYWQSLEGKKEIPAEDTILIIAAHGSPEAEAILELAHFAARRVKLTPVGRVEPCFVVLGKPKLADVLMQSASLSYKRVVVQPHLLLKGRYHDSISDQVETFRREYPRYRLDSNRAAGPRSVVGTGGGGNDLRGVNQQNSRAKWHWRSQWHTRGIIGLSDLIP